MRTSNNASDQPKHTLLTGFDSFDAVEQDYTPKKLNAYLYCHHIDKKHLSKGFLPRCPILEKIYKDTPVSGILLPSTQSKDQCASSFMPGTREYKLALIGELISLLSWWVKEKVEPENQVFWFYAYSYDPCMRRVILVNNFLNNLITEFNFSHPAIANEIKELAGNLVKKAIEWDKHTYLWQQWQQWIDPSRLNPVEVKGAAAALLYKLWHIGSMVREETADLQQADLASKQGKDRQDSKRQKVKKRRALLKKVIKERPDINSDVSALVDSDEIQEYKEYIKENFKKAELKQTIRNDLKNI